MMLLHTGCVRNQTPNRRWSFHVRVALFILVSTVALLSQARVCEPYTDHRGRPHIGFHCPRLSDNKTLLFCCYHNNTAFKYCCNETELLVTRVNATSASDQFAQNNYTAVIAVWVYGFLVLALILMDFVYYAAGHSELCGVYLEKWGLGGRWLRRVRRLRRQRRQQSLEQPEPQEHKPGLGTDAQQHHPNT